MVLQTILLIALTLKQKTGVIILLKYKIEINVHEY